MTIDRTINFFKNSLRQTEKKSEIKIYNEYIIILSNLKDRNLTSEGVNSIEEKLKHLQLTSNPANTKKYFKKQLEIFKKYLREEFSLVTKGYYASMGLSLGMVFGMAIGTSVFGAGSGVTTGMMFGMLIGLIIGRYKDSEAEKENRVLRTNLK